MSEISVTQSEHAIKKWLPRWKFHAVKKLIITMKIFHTVKIFQLIFSKTNSLQEYPVSFALVRTLQRKWNCFKSESLKIINNCMIPSLYSLNLKPKYYLNFRILGLLSLQGSFICQCYPPWWQICMQCASDTDDNTPVLGMPVIVLQQRVC